MERRSLHVPELSGFDKEIGRWIWCLEDVRRTLLARLSGVSQRILDAKLEGRQSIGSLLYHIAYVEAGWLYGEVLCTEMDPEIEALLPYEGWSEEGLLTHIEGESLEDHLSRLNRVREVFLFHFQSMDLADWRKPRILDEYDVTPEWVVYHLIEHESQHRGQIFQLLRQLG